MATNSEIRSWSYGAIKSLRSDVFGQSYLCNSLDDQAIFGPVVSYQCACGRYTNDEIYFEVRDLIVCETCGVKYTSSDARRQRFAHIELHVEMPHPFLGSHKIDCFPVLPRDFFANNANAGLIVLYERLIGSATEPAREKEKAVRELADYIELVAGIAWKWKLTDRDLLCKGVGLLPKETRQGSD